jgi:hypothetical protein
MKYLKRCREIGILGVVFLFSAFCGCDAVENGVADLKGMMQQPLETRQEENKQGPETSPAAGELRLPTMSDLFGGEAGQAGTASTETGQAAAELKTFYTVTLFFKDGGAQALKAEQRAVDKVEGIARRTMEELISGPVSGDCAALFPAGTMLTDINITSDGLCVVDFNRAFSRVEDGDKDLLYDSIARTLDQFERVQKVELRVEGVTEAVLEL